MYFDGGKKDLKRGFYPWAVEFEIYTDAPHGVFAGFKIHCEAISEKGTARIMCQECKHINRLRPIFAYIADADFLADVDKMEITRRVRNCALRFF